jgi:hypothetical protein
MVLRHRRGVGGIAKTTRYDSRIFQRFDGPDRARHSIRDSLDSALPLLPPRVTNGAMLRLIHRIRPCQAQRRKWVERAISSDRTCLWQRTYETRIFDAHREVIGRGPTPEASQKAAERKWVTELQVEEK